MTMPNASSWEFRAHLLKTGMSWSWTRIDHTGSVISPEVTFPSYKDMVTHAATFGYKGGKSKFVLPARRGFDSTFLALEHILIVVTPRDLDRVDHRQEEVAASVQNGLGAIQKLYGGANFEVGPWRVYANHSGG